MGESTEDYLRAMYVIKESQGSIRPSDIASYLHVSRASVSEMLGSLRKAGFIDHKPYGDVSLTSKGYRVAQRMTARHRIIESFLTRMLDVPHSRVHREAHRLEHAFSDDVVRRLYRHLNTPQSDPHGKPIPSL